MMICGCLPCLLLAEKYRDVICQMEMEIKIFFFSFFFLRTDAGSGRIFAQLHLLGKLLLQ